MKSSTKFTIAVLVLVSCSAVFLYSQLAYSQPTEKQELERQNQQTKRIVSGYKILSSNTEQIECWTTPELAKKGLKQCTAVIHSDARWVYDEKSKQWKNFTDVANMTYSQGLFNLTFKDWSIVIGNSIKTKDGKEYKHKDLDKFFKQARINRKGIVKDKKYSYEWGVNISNIDTKKHKFEKVGFEIVSSSGVKSVKKHGNCWLVNNEVRVCFGDLLRYNYTVEYDSLNDRFLVGNVSDKRELFLDPTSEYFGQGTAPDAYVYSWYGSYEDNNYGSSTSLEIYTDSNEYSRWYIRYDLSTLNIVNVTSATFYAYAYDADPGYTSRTRVAESKYISDTSMTDTWEESTITWNNQPCGDDYSSLNGSCNNTAMDTNTISTWNTWYSWDVTYGANEFKDDNFTLVIDATSGGSSSADDKLFASKEYTSDTSKRPYLSITYTEPDTTPPTWSSFGQNATSISAGDTIQMWANISDDVALDYAWLATNESGTWVNYTTTEGRYVDLNGETNAVVYLNWTNASFTGDFSWKIYFNDTSGNVNSTELLPKYEIFDASESEVEKAWEANLDSYSPTYTPPRTGVSGQYDDQPYSNIASSDDTYADDAGSSLTYPSLEIAFNTTKPLGYKFAIGNITIVNEGHGRSASYAYGVWVWNFTSSSWVNLIDETGHDTDITASISSTNPDDLISSSLGDYIAYLYTAHNWKSSTGKVYVDYIYMKVEYNASFVTVTQITDLSFSIGLPATGCTEGKGSTDADATCDRCWIEPTSWTMNNNLLSATQVGCEGQTDSVAFYNITNSGNVNLNITFALNETLDTTKFRNKMSQVSTGYESTCSGDVTTGCVYVESTTPVTVIWDLAPGNSQELWQWGDFIDVALSDTKTLEQNITSSQS